MYFQKTFALLPKVYLLKIFLESELMDSLEFEVIFFYLALTLPSSLVIVSVVVCLKSLDIYITSAVSAKCLS